MGFGLFGGATDRRLPLTPPRPFGVEPEIFELESWRRHQGVAIGRGGVGRGGEVQFTNIK